MYKNVGKKLQAVAKILAWVGIIICLLLGIFCVVYGARENEEYFYNGLFILLVGPITCWVSSLTLFGFGKLVEDNEAMRKDIEAIKNKL